MTIERPDPFWETKRGRFVAELLGKGPPFSKETIGILKEELRLASEDTMSQNERTDPAALDLLYSRPAAEPGQTAAAARGCRRVIAALRRWLAEDAHLVILGQEPEAERRIRLERVAVEHARRLAVLAEWERVEVLREIARLVDVEPWIRAARRPDRRMRTVEEIPS